MARARTAHMRMVLGMFVAGVLLLSVHGAASGSGVYTPPPECGSVGKDYTDATCLVQTRNGTFALDRNEVRPGEKLTGTVSNRCLHRSTGDFSQPPDKPCPIDWDELIEVGEKLSGCAPEDASCTVRISKKAEATGYKIVTVGISSDQGTGISKDYYRIVGSKCKVKTPKFDWAFALRPFCEKNLCVKQRKWKRGPQGLYTTEEYPVPTGPGPAARLVGFRPTGVPEKWKGADKSLFDCKLGTQSPHYVISAHGAWVPSVNGYTRVPPGTTVVTYVPIGTKMDGSLGPQIDTGHTAGLDNRYKVTYEADDLMPNFNFEAFDGAEGQFVRNINSPTTLNAELKPNMGTVAISACATVYLPPGQTLDETLASAPVYTPGSSEPTNLAAGQQPTVTPNGRLQIR